VLFQDEKGPIAAKTYGGTSWCSVQAKVEHAQKIKGILNVFGIYDYTNDRMFTHCYKKKNSKEFIDFIQRVDSLYDSSVKTIYSLYWIIYLYIKQRKLLKKRYHITILE
jgi:hypothetical protein